MEKTVRVELGPRSYDVHVGAGLMDGLGPAVREVTGAAQAVVITETNVGPIYADRATDSLRRAGMEVASVWFPAGETHKHLGSAQILLDQLFAISPAIDRQTLIVALGGGVAGDLGGFVAAVALRGLSLFQCPTSLLADVDSSVGGKTGVDHQAGKNLIGAFHQPGGVLIDVETLRTLPAAELSNGLAECVKHAVIRDAALMDFIESNAEAIQAGRPDGALGFDADVMIELIARNVAIKAGVVAEDEREAGRRAHLNFGHTIGHAIETFVGYDTIRHGEAVALGMVAANGLAVERGLLGSDVAQRVRDLLGRLRLPTARPGLADAAGEIWQIMQHDKKARGGKVRMILPTDLGSVDIYDDIKETEVEKALAIFD